MHLRCTNLAVPPTQYRLTVVDQISCITNKLGRSTRIRTLDPLVPNQMRYQTALHSENWLRRLDSNQRFLAYETKRIDHFHTPL